MGFSQELVLFGLFLNHLNSFILEVHILRITIELFLS